MSKRKSIGSSASSQPSVRRYFNTSDGIARSSTRPSKTGASASVDQNTANEDPSSDDGITSAEIHVHRREVQPHTHQQSTIDQTSSRRRNSRDTHFVVIFCTRRYLQFSKY